jgi:outer membrane protein OmpA-like peptidoglycan-associated protein
MKKRLFAFRRHATFLIDPASLAAPLTMAGLFLATLSIAGCEHPKDLIVLLEDPQGKTGSVEVTSAAGRQTLDRSGSATGVSDAAETPRSPYRIDGPEIESIFGAAIKARPVLPASFTLYFHLDSSNLTDAARAAIAKIVDEVKRRPVSQISIFGHADRTGSDAVNVRISQERATVVRDTLDAAGLRGATYIVEYFGDRDPLIPTAPDVAEPRNRRVEVIVR